MGVLSAQAVVDEIVAYIQKQGGSAGSWYAGITGDVDQRVFTYHQVLRSDSWWIYRTAVSSDAARAAEKALIDWGCDGGGGDASAVLVYAYLKSPKTKQ